MDEWITYAHNKRKVILQRNLSTATLKVDLLCMFDRFY